MKKFFLTLLLTAMICVPFTASAQITIGSGNPPSPWSLLDLQSCDNNPKALHLPRLNLSERNALGLEDLICEYRIEESKGLMIFRIDCSNPNIGCLEVWNGEEWMSFCESDPA